MTEKKHTGFAALYELDQETDRQKAKDLPKNRGVVDQENERPIGRPFSDRTPAPDARKRTPDPKDWASVEEIGSEQTGRPVAKQTDAHLTARSDARLRVDKRQKKKMTVRYSSALEQEIREFCARHGLEINDLHALAIVHFMEAMENRTSGSDTERTPGNIAERMPARKKYRTPHDDLKIIFKSEDNIIMLFQQITGRKWRAEDDREGARFNKVDPRIIEIGMLTTRLQSRRPQINSFKYFIPEIEFLISADVSEQNLNVNVRRLREKFAKWKEERKKK
jgi:hypothetical protein